VVDIEGGNLKGSSLSNALNSDSSEWDDSIFGFAGIVGFTNPWVPPARSWYKTI